MDIYSLPEVYDRIFAFTEDLSYYQDLSDLTSGGVLELACGTGRVIGNLGKTRNDCFGLDLSEKMIARARAQFPKTEFLISDMRDFQLNRQFGLIIIALNSLLHLHSRSEVKELLECVKKHLLPNGEFTFSIFNPSPKILARHPDERHLVAKFFDSDKNTEVFIEETTAYDLATQVSRNTWYYSTKDEKDFFSHPLSLRNYFPQEIDQLMDFHGLEIVGKYGDYDRSAFSSKSSYQIIRASKRPDI